MMIGLTRLEVNNVMDKVYEHQKYETDIYKKWEDGGTFAPEINPSGEPFTIIMPPPNANDPLHVGHAMFVSVEDIFARYQRMRGKKTLWLPGTDHAGIETQYVFEKKLGKEGKSRYDFDRQTLYQMIWEYVQENSGVAVEQMKRLGASADWTRFKFTLDPDVVDLVLSTFEKLYKESLVYRGERLVNYCVKCGTSYSELEVEHEERNDKLYFLKYPLLNGGELVVATTRPETMVGDTAVAVNPQDKRYKEYIGREVKLPLTDRVIPIIGDEMVDMEFGTGAVKITPAHDPADYETAQRHGLPMIQVVDFSGKMTREAKELEGLKVLPAREEVINKLKELNLVEKIVDYIHSVGVCYRCGTVIEPLPLAQFFVKTRKLADRALEALDKKETVILGAGREKILRDWLENIKDWNISRQIVWGIRIPVWYNIDENPDLEVVFKNAKGETVKGKADQLLQKYSFEDIERGLQAVRVGVGAKFVVGKEKPDNRFLQETDTFDTWFSSGQWPVVTLKTTKPGDFERYYPTSVMETGYDILTRWIMRMMILGIYLTDHSPFEKVYLHGLVRDEKGRKMSKSIGNVINPLDLVERYGADALRMALVMGGTPGNDSSVGENKVKGMRNLSNKIWNAARYVLRRVEERESGRAGEKDMEFEKKLAEVVERVTDLLEKLRVGQAAEAVYNEFWHWFCDECIEENKKGNISTPLLYKGLITFLGLWHPFMPFVTEAIWQELGEDKMLITERWPSL